MAGHVSMNQESFVQSSQAILQGLAEGGYIHAKTPNFESFFGDDKKNKLDFDMWERQVLSAATTHSGTAIKQAMMQSLKGQALMVTSALPPETSWEKLLQFYGTKMELDEKCASFGTRLEQKLNQVSLCIGIMLCHPYSLFEHGLHCIIMGNGIVHPSLTHCYNSCRTLVMFNRKTSIVQSSTNRV